jgi:hypothetical protein
MDLVVAVVFCNCVMAIVAIGITIWTIRIRRQLISIAESCNRWENECQQILSHAPAALAIDRGQIARLRQLYQQQLLTLDRLRSLGLLWGISRSLFINRRRGFRG